MSVATAQARSLASPLPLDKPLNQVSARPAVSIYNHHSLLQPQLSLHPRSPIILFFYFTIVTAPLKSAYEHQQM